MTIRTLLRHHPHTIVTHPSTDVTYKADCLGCGWSAELSTDARAVDIECLSHAGRSNHRGFRRIVTGFAVVVRDGEDPCTETQGVPHAR